MKMREELDLYKRKTAALEDQVVLLKADHEHILKDWQQTQEQELNELTTKHTKVVESKDNTIRYRDDSVKDLTTQVNNLHDILDVIPGVLPREKEGQYGNSVNPCHVRLASVLAQKFM